jgi:hypothetical protein
MIRDREPTRLSGLQFDEPEDLRRALVAARRGGPDAAARARIASRVSAAVNDPGAPRAGRGGWRGAGWRPVVATAGLASVTLLTVLALRPARTAEVSVPLGGHAPASLPPLASAARPAPVAVARPSAVPSALDVALAPASVAVAVEAPALAPAPLAAAVRIPSRPMFPHHAQPRPAASSAHRGGGASAVASEGELLRRAQEALRGDPDRALALVAEHAALYPTGALEQERDVIAVEALVRLGRRDQAQSAAQGFLARHPDSPHRAHVEALMGRRNAP